MNVKFANKFICGNGSGGLVDNTVFPTLYDILEINSTDRIFLEEQIVARLL
jgi:hypothetical protein